MFELCFWHVLDHEWGHNDEFMFELCWWNLVFDSRLIDLIAMCELYFRYIFDANRIDICFNML